MNQNLQDEWLTIKTQKDELFNMIFILLNQKDVLIADLEADLADVKAKRDTLMGCFFEFETVAPNGDLMASVLDMNKRILELEAENKVLKDKTRWIPVSEKLPPEAEFHSSDYVLVYQNFQHQVEAYYDFTDNCWMDGFYREPIEDVTHWMPLPELPEF